MRKLLIILCLLVWSVGAVTAAEFRLSTGEVMTGEPVLATANDQGVQIKIAEGEYKRVAWSSFSQEDLKNFAKNSKLEPFVQPFIEVDIKEKRQKTQVNIKEPPRLPQPPRQSLIVAMVSSSMGLFMLFLVYAANIYGAYEVSIFRAQPPALVCGLAAIPVLGFIATIAFLAMPTRLKPSHAEEVAAPAEGAPAPAGEAEVNPMLAEGASHPTALHLHAEAAPAKSTLPETVTFQRGQFTFNRRFFETKFPGFFSVVRRDADKDMVLVLKTTRGEFIGQRISRLAANDLHLQVQRGPTTEEVLIPFQEIQQIRLKHKDAAE